MKGQVLISLTNMIPTFALRLNNVITVKPFIILIKPWKLLQPLKNWNCPGKYISFILKVSLMTKNLFSSTFTLCEISNNYYKLNFSKKLPSAIKGLLKTWILLWNLTINWISGNFKCLDLNISRQKTTFLSQIHLFTK